MAHDGVEDRSGCGVGFAFGARLHAGVRGQQAGGVEARAERDAGTDRRCAFVDVEACCERRTGSRGGERRLEAGAERDACAELHVGTARRRGELRPPVGATSAGELVAVGTACGSEREPAQSLGSACGSERDAARWLGREPAWLGSDCRASEERSEARGEGQRAQGADQTGGVCRARRSSRARRASCSAAAPASRASARRREALVEVLDLVSVNGERLAFRAA